MSAKWTQFALMCVTIVVLAVSMAAAGGSDPDWAEYPAQLIVDPVYVAGVLILVFALSLASRRLGAFAAVICATPMFLLVGAAPQGIVGALVFFVLALTIGGFAFLAAVSLVAALRWIQRRESASRP